MCGAALKDADLRGANLSGANMRNITGPVKAAIQARWLPPMAPLFSGSSVLTEPRRGSELLLRRPLLMIRGAKAAPSAARCPSMRWSTPAPSSGLSRTSG
ncbi:pentapeptide repeat-containing protein [Nonomuraea sp. M3C6]|uniref:Pentapeptide repeat-containing protein n=1 Tax=Nonomuraea marmarensis TaxID=3351344 RepID=A0ABW7A8N4_9ACTN